jgi:hydroxybutyrate-dimer hydrolase
MYRAVLATTVCVIGLLGAGPAHSNGLTSFIVPGNIDKVEYDGVRDAAGNADDLLSAGLNADGLQSAAPGFVDPLDPTPAELRRRAIYTNYRAITDVTTGGGYGLFWGPAPAPDFDGVEPGLIPGVEYKARIRNPAGSGNVN